LYITFKNQILIIITLFPLVSFFFLLNCIHDTWFLEFEIELGYQGEKLIHYVVINHLLSQTCINQLQSFEVLEFGRVFKNGP